MRTLALRGEIRPCFASGSLLSPFGANRTGPDSQALPLTQSLSTNLVTYHIPPNIENLGHKVQSSMTISTTQEVPLQAALLRRVFSPVEIAQSLPTEVLNLAGQKSDLIRTISSNFAALIAIIFGLFPSHFPVSICRPAWPDFALAKRIIAFFAHNAGSTSYK